jgi:hypothetical protein
LASPNYGEDEKVMISEMLDDVFDWRFMAFACFYFPIVVAKAMTGRMRVSSEAQIFSKDPRLHRFVELHMRAVSAASPLWTAAFYLIALNRTGFSGGGFV